jgi:hypothetical protein
MLCHNKQSFENLETELQKSSTSYQSAKGGGLATHQLLTYTIKGSFLKLVGTIINIGSPFERKRRNISRSAG